MPLTQLDSAAALIVIDLQKGITGFTVELGSADVVSRSAELAKAFRERGLPVVLVNVTGRAPGRVDQGFGNRAFPPDWADLVPELDAQPSDILISKQRVGAVLGTDLDAKLKERGVTQVFMTGIATSMGVEATARSAFDLGYNVVFVSDAMTDLNPVSHKHTLETTFPRMGEVDTTDNVLKALRG
ncbi:isochorismatase family protein [Terracidiphilus gabretensis]|uniref:isochorismatase family protein n=1 Tax=Terracidiphilus gabretensis TaxID=1577687 RepID=UPI00071C0FF7|nr:isochorismatase family protein [Terracidiphilus gabretensis]